jgi:large subunit ribosomal protein L4
VTEEVVGEEVETRPKRAPRTRKAAAAPAERDRLTVTVYSPAGESSGDVKLPAGIFGQEPNGAVMHQAHVRQLNNARQGTAKTKKRGEVSGGGAKPYRQKGTGRARHGSNREPSMVGGGTVFGPQPRSYAQAMPRKMRRLALRSALSVKAGEGRVSVIEGFDLEEPKTRRVVELLGGMGVEDSALVVLATPNELVYRSFNNLPWAKVVLARNLNLYDLFTHEHLVLTRDSLELLEETFGA